MEVRGKKKCNSSARSNEDNYQRAHTIGFYRAEAEVYDSKRFSTAQGEYEDIVEKEAVFSLVDSWQGKKILDLGCGTGRFAIEAAKRGALVVALDSSAEMLSMTNKKAENIANREAIELVNGDAYQLPFRDHEFDGCISINVVNHLRKPGKVFCEVRRVVKPDGFFIMNFANLFSSLLPIALWVNLTKRSVLNNVYSRWDTFSRVKMELNRAGFSPQRIVGLALFPPFAFSKNWLHLPQKLDNLLKCSAFSRISNIVFIYNKAS